uniref:ADAMTS like 5 n=1 Tax=Anas zonorhyncha TaxID=75864 RepID=A0A8B9U061_9AVES
MAVPGSQGGLAPPAHLGGPHGTGHRWPWRALLLAWLSLGCGIGTAQGSAPEVLVQGPEPPARARPRRQLARGTWGPWGPWSACSSSCGDGVAFRARRCLRSPPEEPCTGDPRQYRLCQLQGCPGGSVPFRAMQCSLYDDKPIPGTQARYRWVPFYGAPNACDLNCLAVGHNFYYTFGRVLDGTRCGPDSSELCVGGRCLSVGCDGILGLGARPHACGRCGGGQDGCLVVHRLFQGTEPPSALMTSDGRYVLNGDWSIAWPGPYEAAGTRLLYARSPDGAESLEAPGPTAEDLHVLVLLQEPNPGIEYEFWLPRGHPQPPDTSPLRQPQPRGAGSPPPEEPPVPTPPPRTQSHTTEPPRTPPGRSGVAAGRCGRCRPPKGRSQRIRHFCQSDFGEHQAGWGGDRGTMLGAMCPAQAAPHHPCSLPSPDPGAALGGAGDALRGAGADSVPAPLPAGAPRVRLGARRLRLPPAAGGPRVPADGEAPRQLRAHPEPHPAAARRLRPPVVPPRGPAGAGGSAALRTATATLSPQTHRPGGGSGTPGVGAGP